MESACLVCSFLIEVDWFFEMRPLVEFEGPLNDEFEVSVESSSPSILSTFVSDSLMIPRLK